MSNRDEPKTGDVKAQTKVKKEVSSPKIKEDVQLPTKMSIRNDMWSKLESNDLVLYPRPCKFRIPRIKGENEAVERLAQLDVFKKAKVVKIHMDKAHERVRLEVIQSGKKLVAGTPGLREAAFLYMRPPMEPNKMANKMAASRIGINHLGIAFDFSSDTKVDLIIIGSVAVDKKGHRIGKGESFSDLEYALLSKLGAISSNAVILTIVHDIQVSDELPESLFKPHDVPVDVIITPTQVIQVEKQLPRPSLMWNLLSNRRVNNIPILRQLLDKEQLGGIKVELKEVDSEPESQRPLLPIRMRRFMGHKRQASAPEQRQQERSMSRESSAAPTNRSSRTFRRRPMRQMSAEAESPKIGEPEKVKLMRRGPMRRISKPRYNVDFSIRVNGLTSSIRIRDLKAALIERGVRPIDISWRPVKGVALLHFAKCKHLVQETVPATPTADVDEVVASLQGLSIKSEDGQAINLSVEAAKPIVHAEPTVEPTDV